ncbi:hypothetical protein GF351_03375 [Candidatus Woesearchaeota archaeon]|nr:hypothetical protein [Candidatus Woesearchaeota archaeon]
MSLEKSIRNIKNTFGNPAHREHILEEMQLAAFRHFTVPYVCVEALDVMIPRFLEGSLEKNTAIVMAEARKTPSPTAQNRYQFRFLGMHVEIGRYDVRPGSAMQVRAQLDSRYILRYSGYIDGEIVHSSEHVPEREPGRFISENTPLFLLGNIYADKYTSFKGVAIKKGSGGLLKLAGGNTLLPKDRYYLVMFNKHKQVIFNDKGKIQKAVDVRRDI